MTVRILHGDARVMLATLPDASVQCVVTSPPYWGLRSYGIGIENGEIGLEASPDAYVAEMVAVFREVRRVLRDDGTLWLNIGSSYSSKMIESEGHIIKRDIPDSFRIKIAQALSAVWSGYASPESALQVVLDERVRATAELPRAGVQEMRGEVHEAQIPDGGGEWPILLPLMREIGKPDTKKGTGRSDLSDMREGIGEISSRHEEKQEQDGILQCGMLVQLQPEGRSLPLGGRPGWPDEPRGNQVAKGSSHTGQVSLPIVPCEPEIGSSPHLSIPEPPRPEMGHEQRADVVPIVPSKDRRKRNGLRGSSLDNREYSTERLADLTFPRSSIPPGFYQWCEPEVVIKPKDDIAIPAMVAFALRADGWWLRSDIIWAKKNCMPESVNDRPSQAHEHVFLLTKSARYFYDAEAIREEGVISAGTRAAKGSSVRSELKDVNGRPPEYWDYTGTRNSRNVWPIATQPFSDAHFATFPPELAERCISAGSSERGCCSMCGAPWARDVVRTRTFESGSGKSGNKPTGKGAGGPQTDSGSYDVRMGAVLTTATTGWHPSCQCNAAVVPCTILDPFFGAGTVGLVADRLGRDGVGIELNADYVKMASKRIENDAGMFAEISNV